tara:strand:+ start:687 stop:1316 length:630 start_codon:yes stop_codon:yes gene_type:complete
MAFLGVGTGFNINAASTATLSPCIAQKTEYLRVNTGVATVHVAIGTLPTAVVTDTVITNQQPEIISLGKVRSQPINAVTVPSAGDGVTGIVTLTVPEGYGNQFREGSLIGLQVKTGTGSTDNQTYWNLTNLYVSSVQIHRVNTGISGNGFTDKLTVTGDLKTQNGQTAGIQTGLLTGNTLEARSAFKMSAFSGGVEGQVYAQQIQITGG